MTLNLSRAQCDNSAMFTKPKKAEVRFIVQPTSTHRFRYKSEGRWAGSIPGAKKNTFPTIEISGCSGKALVVISCVTKDEPYKPHPHGVVAREIYRSEEEVKKGACKVEVQLTGSSTQVSFNNIGIQSTTRNQVKEMLRTRETLRVDPFNNGFSYTHLRNIDLNAVRLCFQVVIVDENNKVRYALPPLVSNVIRDKKTVHELVITRISHCAGSAVGGTDMILLCKKVKADDVAVVFFEKSEGRVVWEAAATEFFVHQNYAIAFKTPPYHDVKIATNTQVCLQLKQISNNARSNAMDFEYIASPRERLKPILRKPLPAFLQSFIPMEIEETDSLQAREIPNQIVNDNEQIIMDSGHKPLPQWPVPIELPPLQEPGPSRVDYLPRTTTHQNYHQLDHTHQSYPNVYPHSSHLPPSMNQHVASLITEPPDLQIHSQDIEEHYPLDEQYTNGHGGHVERDTVPPDAPSTSKLNAANEDIRLNSDHFSDIYDSDLSDSLGELSLKDLIGSVWKPDSVP